MMSERGTQIGLLIIFRGGYNYAFSVNFQRAYSLVSIVHTHSKVTAAGVTNHVPCSLVESSEPEDKSAGASGETPSQPYPAPVYSQPEELKEQQMDDEKPTKPEENEESDPLPDNWEMAYTEKGEVYFIE